MTIFAERSANRESRTYAGNYLPESIAKCGNTPATRGYLLNIDRDISSLSPREQQVLKLIALGWRTTQIANQLGIMRKTVGVYRDNVLRKLNLADQRELVQFAWRNGVVS